MSTKSDFWDKIGGLPFADTKALDERTEDEKLIESIMGKADVLKFFYRIGDRISEPKALGLGESKTNFSSSMTPASAIIPHLAKPPLDQT